jgi:hypothetical protein
MVKLPHAERGAISVGPMARSAQKNSTATSKPAPKAIVPELVKAQPQAAEVVDSAQKLQDIAGKEPVIPEKKAQESLQKVDQSEVDRQNAVKAEEARLEFERQEAIRKSVALKEAAARQESQRLEADRKDAAQAEEARQEAARQDAIRKSIALKEAAARQESQRLEAERKAEEARMSSERQEAARLEAERQENAKQAAARKIAEREEQDARREAARRAIGRQLDEEAAARRNAAELAQRTSPPLPYSISTARRGRLFGRADPDAELLAYGEAFSRKIQLNMTFNMIRDAVKQPHTAPTVTVAIRKDGSVESVIFYVSSGVAAIDEAIRNIVQSQAPYPAFSPALASEFDVVEIRRTWNFDVAIRLY